MINPQTFQLPEQLSTGAAEVDDLYMIVFWFSVVFTAIILFCIVYFAWEYRRRPGVKAAPVGHMLTLELAWTIIPLVLIVIPFHYGFKVYVHNAVAAEGATEIRVRGAKWKWEFEYPNGMRENGILRIPVNKPVKFVISSEDVLHSFYVPGSRLKKDAVPGMYSTISFTPIKIGDMQVFCAEYCGTSHSGMLATIRVVSNDEYDKFLKEGAGAEPGELPAAWGARLYRQNSCNTCHSVDGSKMPGPTWKGIWHREEGLSDGTKMMIDENYIKESILKPQAKIVSGYTTVVMPPFVFNDKQIDALIAYMKTL